jgi:SAM-dependent methyltransferase
MRYRVLAVYVAVVVAGTYVWSMTADPRRDGLAVRVVEISAVCVLAVLLYYLPLYLGLSVEARKPAVWSVRMRWVAIPVVACVLVATGDDASDLGASGGAVAALLVANFVGRVAIRSGSDETLAFVPVVHVIAELAALTLLTSADSPAALVSLGFAISGTLFVMTTQGHAQLVGALFVAAVCFVRLGSFELGGYRVEGSDPWLVVAPLAALCGAVVLNRVASRHHRVALDRTVDELAAFQQISREAAADLLVRSTGVLASSWNANPPKDGEAVARWYSENSNYYLYDLAQFHLAYKHVAFSLDVIGLAKGRVLDHGAGIGDVALELARRGHETTYLDVPGETQGFARWRAERDDVPLVFARSLDDATGPFDTIISLDVLEHLPEPRPVVDALVERLAPGGIFVVTAYFGPTKAHPMHFDHDFDLKAYLETKGLRDVKGFALRHLRSEVMRKPGVLVFAN